LAERLIQTKEPSQWVSAEIVGCPGLAKWVISLTMPSGKNLPSEADELDLFLAEIEREEKVKELAGLESGFPGLNRLLNGILPGLYFLVGPPSSGKTSFAKQLCDQVAQCNSVPVLFFTFAERKRDLRIKTLARLSGLENREILRGRSFVLHSYGVPKSHWTDPEMLPPSWEKLKRSAEQAKKWLSYVYLFEASEKSKLEEIKSCAREVMQTRATEPAFVIIDDSQRLGPRHLAVNERLAPVTEELQGAAMDMGIPILATWPELEREGPKLTPHAWGERIPAADVVLVMESDEERSRLLTEPMRAVNIHIVKNRAGEKGRLGFDFQPAFSSFKECSPVLDGG